LSSPIFKRRSYWGSSAVNKYLQNNYLQQYIDQIGTRLARQPGADAYPYQFTVLNQESINAFALPGGPVYVNKGLIEAADNEAQLAGVVAHEISHVALRHGTSQASKANLIQLPAAVAGSVIDGGVVGQLAQLGVGLGAQSVLLKYSRDAEREADALGARIMAQAGYNPVEMANFFEKLEAEGGGRAPEFLSSHPDPGNRRELIQAEIRYIPSSRYGYTTGMFAEAKNTAARISSPRERAD
jgi:beta-barrel assembly-enhancing protease